MFRQTRYPRHLSEIERRIELMERRLDRMGQVAARTASSGFASAAQATDRVGDAVVSALGDIVERFRGGSRSVGSEAARFGQEATKFGNDALRRVSSEIEQRPLVTLAIAAGIGLLIGLAGRRH